VRIPLHEWYSPTALASFAIGMFVVMHTQVGCHDVPPPVVPPDASDASPPAPPSPDASPGPQTPCSAACAELAVLGCREGKAADCVAVLSHIDGAKLIREPSGRPLTCQDIAAAQSIATVRGLGLGCSP
jgi:hypothetical protein